tara:strand:+ start:445 stop:660 length:216 start_codon:yes stop_codon:yes gene_type:complete
VIEVNATVINGFGVQIAFRCKLKIKIKATIKSGIMNKKGNVILTWYRNPLINGPNAKPTPGAIIAKPTAAP